MVQCHGCKVQLTGTWNVNPAGYVDGAYLGVDAYFAYSNPNWVYCYCTTCFSNGKYAQYIVSCYGASLGNYILTQKA